MLVAIALVVAALTGCSGPDATVPRPSANVSAATSQARSLETLASPVTGIVVHIDSSGLAAVHGFTLRLASGATVDFVIGTLDNGAAFPPGHLAEHQATAQSVRVSFRIVGGRRVVYRLEDATQPPAS